VVGLVVIPVLVFDCVALRFREGISGLFSRVNPLGWGLFTLGAAFAARVKIIWMASSCCSVVVLFSVAQHP
jgi:hypothetical protein